VITIHHKITRQGTGFDRSTWRQLLKLAWKKAGELWHRAILPKHFTRAGAAEYHYEKRSAAYMRHKGRRWGHQRPLVYRGELERQVKRTRDVRHTSKGAKVVLHGPRHLHAYRKDYSQPNKAAELRAISKGDAEAIRKSLDRRLQRQIDQGGGKKVVLYAD